MTRLLGLGRGGVVNKHGKQQTKKNTQPQQLRERTNEEEDPGDQEMISG